MGVLTMEVAVETSIALIGFAGIPILQSQLMAHVPMKTKNAIRTLGVAKDYCNYYVREDQGINLEGAFISRMTRTAEDKISLVISTIAAAKGIIAQTRIYAKRQRMKEIVQKRMRFVMPKIVVTH